MRKGYISREKKMHLIWELEIFKINSLDIQMMEDPMHDVACEFCSFTQESSHSHASFPFESTDGWFRIFFHLIFQILVEIVLVLDFHVP